MKIMMMMMMMMMMMLITVITPISLADCNEPSIWPVHPCRAQIRVSGTAVSRTGSRWVC